MEKAHERRLNNSQKDEQYANPGDHNEIIYQALVIRAELHMDAYNLIQQNGTLS